MDRRKALKNMGLTLGYAVATPTLVSIMQSCKNEPTLAWTPKFFSMEEGTVLNHLVDIILPKTDTPSASEIQVDLFIDGFVNEVMYNNEDYAQFAKAMDVDEDDAGHFNRYNKDFLRSNMGKFIEKASQDSGKENAADLTPEDLEPVLASTLKISEEQEKAHDEALEAYVAAVNSGTAATLSDEVARYAFASNLRGLSIWGYKTSEYIGEEVLAYLPVPGEYIACEDVDKLTGGKAWSI
ncbi:gluconate 2-dehydrogenase subunit 3 family protein [Spongiimicrobium sp. 3-5]|uniref:gluconate 2-dehydrogenase subunit 3 family protein n=1 Tax=Spongiimicrobium sp. 3-5 TaxID=3332596 RepID=UPI0039818150